MTQSKATTPDGLVGTRIDGRYTLLGVLGQGGMGVVYDGIHDELGRAVAIKVLNTVWATDRVAVERFLREARVASSFSHGNIVDVSDLGRLPDGRPYLVMPKIPGTDLATVLHEIGPQPAKRVAELLRGVASALDLIHAKGYVHRDIKPENLMYVAREDGSETVMLLDFGIAALVMSNERRLTAQGQVFGTPHYMAPEASTGAVPDARGDVYALAAVAFELITGALPFNTENVMQLLSMKLVNDPPSMSSVSGLAFPPALEAVLARGLARVPAARFASASELIYALGAATRDAPVSWRSGIMRPQLQSDAHPLGAWRDARLGRADTESPPAHSSAPKPSAGFDPNATYILGAGLREAERSQPIERAPVRPRWFGWLGLTLAAAVVGLVLLLRQGAVPHAPAGAASAAPPKTQSDVRAASEPPRVFRPPAQQPQPMAAARREQPAALTTLPQPTAAANTTHSLPASGVAPAPSSALPPASGMPPSALPGAAPAASGMPPSALHGAAPLATNANPAPPAQSAQSSAHPAPAAAVGAALALSSAAAKGEPRPSKPPAFLTDLPEPTPAPEATEPAQAPVVMLKEQEPEPAEIEEPGPDPAQVAQLTQTATAALLRGEVVRAVELLREVTRLDPDHALGWRSLGLALERSGDSQAALDAYQRYLRLVPTGQQADMVRERMRALGAE
jgi:serine/threonine protein kinase